MAKYAVVRGKRLRATLVDSCGMPLYGPRSRIVTDGFVTAKAAPVMRDAQDIEQDNADGAVCVSDRTDPALKWFALTLEFCGVDTDFFNMLLGWGVVTDYSGEDVGFVTKPTVPDGTGVAIELWSGVGSQAGCAVPTSDDILVGAGGNLVQEFGYALWPVFKQAKLGDFEISAKASTFTLDGITAYAGRWGRGPYNVVAIDSGNTAGRLEKPFPVDAHMMGRVTTIAPPDVTTGACPLVLPTPYYGTMAAETADEQPDCDAVASNAKETVTISGTPTGGTFALTFKGQTAAGITYSAAASAVQAALEALSTIGTGNVTVTVTGSGPYVTEFVGDLAGVAQPLMTATGSFTGGTSPGIAVASTQTGGVYS